MYCAAVPRRYRVLVPIARVTSAGFAAPNPQPTASFWVRTPSSRLAMRVSVQAFDPADITRTNELRTYDPGTTGRGLADWQVTPHIDTVGAPNSVWSVPMPLQPVFVDTAGLALARPLPDGFEYQGPVQLFRFDTNLNLVIEANKRPTVYADITWEPGPGGDIDDTQLQALFAQCAAWADSLKSIAGFAVA